MSLKSLYCIGAVFSYSNQVLGDSNQPPVNDTEDTCDSPKTQWTVKGSDTHAHFTFNGSRTAIKNDNFPNYKKELQDSGVKTNWFVLKHPSFFYSTLLTVNDTCTLSSTSISQNTPFSVVYLGQIFAIPPGLPDNDWLEAVKKIQGLNRIAYTQSLEDKSPSS
ncbi:MAG: hypothetical protein S4CHLAM20_00120 [Chlamydiia bacterium]|nr:hypothetical protein [Chlamydiia bacterium]